MSGLMLVEEDSTSVKARPRRSTFFLSQSFRRIDFWLGFEFIAETQLRARKVVAQLPKRCCERMFRFKELGVGNQPVSFQQTGQLRHQPRTPDQVPSHEVRVSVCGTQRLAFLDRFRLVDCPDTQVDDMRAATNAPCHRSEANIQTNGLS